MNGNPIFFLEFGAQDVLSRYQSLTKVCTNIGIETIREELTVGLWRLLMKGSPGESESHIVSTAYPVGTLSSSS